MRMLSLLLKMKCLLKSWYKISFTNYGNGRKNFLFPVQLQLTCTGLFIMKASII